MAVVDPFDDGQCLRDEGDWRILDIDHLFPSLTDLTFTLQDMKGYDRIDLQPSSQDFMDPMNPVTCNVLRDSRHGVRALPVDLGTHVFTNSSAFASAAAGAPSRLGPSGLRDRESGADVMNMATLVSPPGCSHVGKIGHEWTGGCGLKDDLPTGSSMLFSANVPHIRQTIDFNINATNPNIACIPQYNLDTAFYNIKDPLPSTFRYNNNQLANCSLEAGPLSDFGMPSTAAFLDTELNSTAVKMAGVRKIAKPRRHKDQKLPTKSATTTLSKIQTPLTFDKSAIRNEKIAQYGADCLRKYGFCAVNNYLGSKAGDLVLQEVKTLERLGMFEEGQVATHSKGIRGDRIMWIDREDDIVSNVVGLVRRLDGLLMRLNRNLEDYKIRSRSKAMVACYPGNGRGYMRHVDNPAQDGRCITCIYYLNKDWNAEVDGGNLVMYPLHLDKPITIEPNFDRLLFFWSDHRNPHEVQPSYKNRYAITVWYFDDEERQQAKLRYFQQGVPENKRLSPVSMIFDS